MHKMLQKDEETARSNVIESSTKETIEYNEFHFSRMAFRRKRIIRQQKRWRVYARLSLDDAVAEFAKRDVLSLHRQHQSTFFGTEKQIYQSIFRAVRLSAASPRDRIHLFIFIQMV